MSCEVPESWRRGTLSELVSVQRGHDLPEPRRRPGDVPVVGSAGVSGWHDEARAAGPGITIGRSGVGSMGVVSYVVEDYWPLNTVLFVTDFHGHDPRFAYYLLKTIDFRALDSGSAQSSLNRNFIAALPILLPGPREELAIAAVLGSLDDKIASNHRLAATLAELALAEFRGRFVEFIGHELIDGLPVGWEMHSLESIADLHRDLVAGADDLPYIGLDAMPRGSTVLTDWAITDAPAGQTARFDEGDILFGKLRPYLRKIGVAPIAGRCSTEILVVRPRDEAYYGLVLGHVASDRFIEHCVAISSGTRMPRAEWKDAATYLLPVPPEPAVREFSALAQTVYAKIRALIVEARTLLVLRDALLPKLISGQIRVPPDADDDAPGQLVAA